MYLNILSPAGTGRSIEVGGFTATALQGKTLNWQEKRFAPFRNEGISIYPECGFSVTRQPEFEIFSSEVLAALKLEEDEQMEAYMKDLAIMKSLNEPNDAPDESMGNY